MVSFISDLKAPAVGPIPLKLNSDVTADFRRLGIKFRDMAQWIEGLNSEIWLNSGVVLSFFGISVSTVLVQVLCILQNFSYKQQVHLSSLKYKVLYGVLLLCHFCSIKKFQYPVSQHKRLGVRIIPETFPSLGVMTNSKKLIKYWGCKIWCGKLFFSG